MLTKRLTVAWTTCSCQPSESWPRSCWARDYSEPQRHDEAQTHTRSLTSVLLRRSSPSISRKLIPTAGHALFTTCYPHTSPSSTLSSLSSLHSFCLPLMFSRPPPIARISPPTSNLYLGAMLAAPTQSNQAFQHHLCSVSYTLLHRQSCNHNKTSFGLGVFCVWVMALSYHTKWSSVARQWKKLERNEER